MEPILGPHGLSVHSPFTDQLGLTFPADYAAEVDDVLRPYLVEACGSLEVEGLWRLPRLQRRGDGVPFMVRSRRVDPTVKLWRRGGVYCVGMSGGSCETFRVGGMWEHVLCDLGQFAHRVTRIDASVDLPIDGPGAVARVLEVAYLGGVRLGRKAVRSTDVREYRKRDARGALAGTAYLGAKNADIRGKVYCKRAEMEDNGLEDPGPLTRIEMSLSVDGITLRDAAQPGALFWHYVGDLLSQPDGVSAWSAGDTGFMLDPRQERDYWRILKRRVEEWVELQELRLLSLKLGEYGPRVLLGLIARALGFDDLPASYALPRVALARVPAPGVVQ